MTDRELLELAAKAYLPDENYTNAAYMRGFFSNWNPLTDDGDALRLAVKLAIDVEFFIENGTTSAVQVEYCDYRCNIGRNEVEPKGDIFAATRRAIVRAAAEIGRAME